jgi:2-dehydropantoate 2-reductase
MKIAVMGTGGVGGYFGTRLALGGSDVAFVARGAQLAAMREHGLRVRSAGGDLHLAPVRATDDPREIGPVDLVLFGVKLWDTAAAAAAIRPIVTGDAMVVSLQNGVVKDDILMETLGRRAVIGGVCYIAATIAEPGVIVHTGTMQRLVFGEYDGTRSARVELFEAACRQAGIDAEVSADITRALWEKFVFLVAFSAVTATTRRPIGAVRAHPQTRRLLAAAMQEVVDVGRAQGVALAPDFVADRLRFADQLPVTMTSSMANDLERGNRLEVPWLSGDVARRGAAVGVPSPVNGTLFDVLSIAADGVATR